MHVVRDVANETRKRLSARDTRNFERVSLAMGALVGAVLTEVIFWMYPWTVPPYWLTPMYVLTDSVWAMPILAVCLYISAWMATKCYRGMMRIGMRGIERRRCGRAIR